MNEQSNSVTPNKSKFSKKLQDAKKIDKKWKDINPEYYIWSIELENANKNKLNNVSTESKSS